MKRAILFFCMFIIATELSAQEKPKPVKADTSVTLDLRKLQNLFNKLQDDLKHANEQIDIWTVTRDKTIGRIEALQELANNQSFRLKEDSTFTIKKGSTK